MAIRDTVISLLQRRGVSATLSRRTIGEVVPSTGKATESFEDVTVQCSPLFPRSTRAEETVSAEASGEITSRLRAILGPEANPTVGSILTVSGQSYKVESFQPFSDNSETIAWEVFLLGN